MEYRRRYLRRFGNQNQDDKDKEASQNNKDTNKLEEKVDAPKNEQKVNNQNVYLQKLLQKSNNVQNSPSISITTVKDSLPSFRNSIHDILSTDENKQRAIKYVMQKRNDFKKNKLQINTENEQEESNPVLANRYTNYQNRINSNNSNNIELNYNKNVNINSRQSKKENQQDIKPNFSHYYARRTKTSDININNDMEQINKKESNNINNNTNINNNNKIDYSKGRKIQISVSTNNMLQNIKNVHFEKNEINIPKRNRPYNVNSYKNKSTNIIKEEEETKPRFKYYRGYIKRYEDEQKEKEKEIELDKEVVNNSNEYSISLNVGKNFSFGVKDMLSNKSLGNQSSTFDKEEDSKFKGYKNFKIIKNNFQLKSKYKKDVYTKKSVFGKQKIDKKDIIKDKVIDFKLLGTNKSSHINTNSEIPNSRFRRKYGRFSSDIDNQSNKNLSFNNEAELISYLTKEYDQDKLMELLNIKKIESQNNQNISPEIKQLKVQLNEEKRKNEENEKKLKQLESNIGEQTNEIRDKNKGIGQKIQEIDKLKNDISIYKKNIQ